MLLGGDVRAPVAEAAGDVEVESQRSMPGIGGRLQLHQSHSSKW
jgi:hypothetical protein